MLTTLRIRNFKSWKDTGMVRPRPVDDFLRGKQRPRKTSLLQFLLMLQAKLANHRISAAWCTLVMTTRPFELGTFQDLIFDHDLNNKLEFEFSWTLPKPLANSGPLEAERRYRDRHAFVSRRASLRLRTFNTLNGSSTVRARLRSRG